MQLLTLFGLDKSRPAIMGIVNVTPDSFSDGGLFLDSRIAIEHALKLAEEGADILDIGGESTRPGAEPVGIEEELQRVIPVIEGIRKKLKIPISIDTTKSHVAHAAIEAGADMINDISAGRFDPVIFQVAAKANCPICLMHMQGEPRTMQVAPHYDDVIDEVYKFLGDAIERAVEGGVGRSNIIIDPGIGFGKSVEDNIMILKRLAEFGKLGAPILIGTSRKSFIGRLLGCDALKRLEGSLATACTAINHGASVLRVHDVGATRRFVTLYLLTYERANVLTY